MVLSGVRGDVVRLNLALMTFGAGINSAIVKTWRGPAVTPEHRWSPYERKWDYPCPESTQRQTVEGIELYGLYTCTCF